MRRRADKAMSEFRWMVLHCYLSALAENLLPAACSSTGWMGLTSRSLFAAVVAPKLSLGRYHYINTWQWIVQRRRHMALLEELSFKLHILLDRGFINRYGRRGSPHAFVVPRGC